MALMQGSVRRHNGGGYRIAFDVGVNPDGTRRQYRRGGYRTKAEAQAALEKAMMRHRSGQRMDIDDLTVEQWLTTWLASKHATTESTRRHRQGHIDNYLVPHLGRIPLLQLRADHIDQMFTEIRAEGRLSPATMHRIHSTLRASLNGAMRQQMLQYNPALQIELESETRQPTSIWSPEDLTKFLQHAAGDGWYPAFHLCAMTGLRRGELAALRWDDVVLDDGLLRVPKAKTSAGVRTVALDQTTVGVLRAHRVRQGQQRLAYGVQDSGYVFTRVDATPVKPAMLLREFYRLTDAARLPRIRLHDLRHTHASLGLAAGVPLKVMSDRLGHSTIVITANLYTHVLPAAQREAAETVAALIHLPSEEGRGNDVPAT
jgi:integrase